MNYSVNDLIELPDEKIDRSLVSAKICQEYIKLYSGFKIKSFDDKDPICFVAHQNLVSFYDIIGGQWTKHMRF